MRPRLSDRAHGPVALVEATLYELTSGKDTWKTTPGPPQPHSHWIDPTAVAMSRHSVTPAAPYMHTPVSAARQPPPPIWRTPVSTHATPTAVFSRMPSPAIAHGSGGPPRVAAGRRLGGLYTAATVSVS